MIKTQCWLVLEGQRWNTGNQIREVKVSRVTQGVPKLESNQVAVKLNVAVPESVFDGFITANLTVDEDNFIIPAEVSISQLSKEE